MGVTLNAKEKKTQLVVYENQWRFRSVDSIRHNGKFYFNTGSLDANEMIKQFIDVMISYEMMGVQILGFLVMVEKE